MPRRPATPSLLRSLNDQSALELLLREGPLTRVDLGRRTGLSKVTASQLLSRLQERHLVQVVGSQSAGRGPSAELYAVRNDCAYGIGVELNPGRLRATVADVTGTVVGRIDGAVSDTDDPQALIHTTVVRVAEDAGITVDQVDDVVIGIPGVVDPVTGDVELSFDLPGWHHGLRQTLATDLGCELTFENDVNLAAVAERSEGAGHNVDDMVLLWVGRGVGLAVALSGHIHRGATGAAGEIGYLPVPGVPSPASIDVPAKGGFQALAGAAAISDLAREHGMVADGAAQAVRAALVRTSDTAADDFLHAFADRLALGVAAVCAVVDPALVVVAGDVGAAGGEPLCDMVATAVQNIAPVHPKVVPALVTDAPVLRGATLTAVEKARMSIFADQR
ncbi:ROK family transcriptional regulator [Phytoactinopolyspora halotolerans]|uniref:ROK family transcriptional regulator n=1 Tax=Phytoactinopolyspora halotolerans TaxID=1981512 RepID=A0A6L9SC81_9ACTN|nr:ROK family transcriptional regulator [Phytoactinopolyspora halotolerans]NEE02284.1 ROK family transcriptional regulator [Phytoactinopolyspora halotolerans]